MTKTKIIRIYNKWWNPETKVLTIYRKNCSETTSRKTHAKIRVSLAPTKTHLIWRISAVATPLMTLMRTTPNNHSHEVQSLEPYFLHSSQESEDLHPQAPLPVKNAESKDEQTTNVWNDFSKLQLRSSHTDRLGSNIHQFQFNTRWLS